jgi:hypothetical protein
VRLGLGLALGQAVAVPLTLSERLARALVGLQSGRPQPTPKLAGCRLSATQLTLVFDAALLGGEGVVVQAPIPGALVPLELQTMPWNASVTGWVHAAALVVVNATAVAVPLEPGTIPSAVRYAWGDYACCPGMAADTFFCPPTACPIVTSATTEPAVPFWAAIVGGKCQCDLPWVCDA